MADKPANSPKPESLDEIVGQSAVVIAEQIRNAANWAKSEMDLQVEVEGILKDFARQAKIDLKGHQDVTIATGRADAVYGSVIIEYKKPGTLSPNKEAAPNKAVVDQLKRRFYDMNREEHRNWRSMFGVGTDGKYFIFLRFRDDKWTDQEPLEVNRYSTERFLWALYNLGQKGKPYQPEYLHGDSGSEGTVAQEGGRLFLEGAPGTENPSGQVLFNYEFFQPRDAPHKWSGYRVPRLTVSDRLIRPVGALMRLQAEAAAEVDALPPSTLDKVSEGVF
jgi:hypothetical protein